MKILTKTSLAFVLLLVSSGLNNAGTGKFKNGAFNFCVSVRFNATADQLQKIRTGFQQASELLEDATDGQHYFGNISIVNNDAKSSGLNADFWIVPSNSPLLIGGQSNAPTGTFGMRGQTAYIKLAEFEGTIHNPSGVEVLKAARTIAHEFAHFAYALRDEYKGPGDVPAECAAPSTSIGSDGTPVDNRGEFNYCLMDQHHTQLKTWFDDALPTGATATANEEPWTWINTNPAPVSGNYAHVSPNASGVHQHSFTGATQTMTVQAGEMLFAYVYLDPVNPPQEIMLQWRENGSWEHRVSWGANLIPLAKIHYPVLPPAGKWVRLMALATPTQVNLEGKTVDGMAFTVYGGQATWDRTGTVAESPSFSNSEFCVSSNHDKANSNGIGADNTMQTASHHLSCWETMALLPHPIKGITTNWLAKQWKLKAPSDLPNDTPPATPHQVTFDTTCGPKKIVLLIDRSGSMAQFNNRLVFAKLGASQFIKSFEQGDALGLVSFSDSISVDYPLSEVTGESTRNAITAAVNSLQAGGGTDIGDGLLMALNQLTGDDDCNCEKTIILLTDGEHNVGTPPESVLPALQRAGIRLQTATVGSQVGAAGEESLQHMADATGGSSISISGAFDPSGTPSEAYSDAALIGFFSRISNDVKGNSMVAQQREVIAANQTKEFDVFVEQNATSVSFTMNATDQADQLTLTLRTPSGVVITQADASTNPNIKFETSSGSQTFHIQTPESGDWKVVATTGSVQTGKFELLAFADHPGLRLNALGQIDTSVTPQVIQIQASPTYEGINVMGANISGNVVKPDGTRANITLYDDGLAEHGDLEKDDGLYTARFSDITGGGSYTFELTANNTNGLLVQGEDDFSPSIWESVPPFTRVANTMVSIPTGSLSLSLWVTRATAGAGNDGDDVIEPGEEGLLRVYLRNGGASYARNLSAVLTSSTPGVTITANTSNYPDIPSPIKDIDDNILNLPFSVNDSPFTFTLAPDFPCGADIHFELTVTQAGTNTSQVFNFDIHTGGNSFSDKIGGTFGGPAVAIPDNDPIGVDIPVQVSGSVGNIAKLNLLFVGNSSSCLTDPNSSVAGLNHSAVSDLIVRLTSPQGTSVTLIDRAGGIGHNFCRTRLDDSGSRSIQDLSETDAPFSGTFKPANPLAAFNGENPTGTWILNVSDRHPGDTGSVRDFLLEITGSSLCGFSPGATPTPTPDPGPTFGMNRRIAFTSVRDGNREIYVMDYDGRNQTRLTFEPEDDNQPIWSPAADKIAFISNRGNGTDDQIFVINPDGSDPVQVSFESGHKSGLAWSPDGSKVVYTTSASWIVIARTDGSGSYVVNQVDFGRDPSWSPDGTKIAFVRAPGGTAQQVWVMDVNGNNVTMVSTDGTRKFRPLWSPDGTRILYQGEEGSNANLFVVNANGTNQTALTSGVGLRYDQSWSPDGSRIVFANEADGYSSIDVVNADGSGSHRVSQSSGFDYEPQWAPDGSRIVFTGNDGISVINVDGTGQRLITNGWDADFNPTWQPIPSSLMVGIVEPGDGKAEETGSSLTVRAKAFTRTGTITQVEFFADGDSIGVAANPADPSINWTVPAGNHRLAAVATNSSGATSSSLPVNIQASALPQVSITNPQDQLNLSAGSTIMLAADTSDDSIRSVKFMANGLPLGLATSNGPNHYVFQWNLVASGAYDLTAIASNAAGTTTSNPVHVTVSPPAGGGFLSAAVKQTPASVNLTSEGTLDWAHWGLGSPSSFDHKAGAQLISNFTRVGQRANFWFGDNTTTFSWTDGTPTNNATNTPTGIFINGQGNGFEFTVPADSNLKTLKLYVGAWFARGQLQAALSDESAGVIVNEGVNGDAGSIHRVYTIRFRSTTAAQQLLRVRYTMANDYFAPFGNITLEAATLTTGSGLPTPDRKIVFVSERDGNPEIYVVNPDGSQPTNLTNDPLNDYDPVWSPDGNRIAFDSDRDDPTNNNSSIYVMNADGTQQTRLTNNPDGDYSPVWSPTGSKIAYLSFRNGNNEIVVMDTDGGNQTQLTFSPQSDQFPTWSPDGSKLAFESWNNGYPSLFVINVDGSGLTQISSNLQYAMTPKWAPNGNKILFEGAPDSNTPFQLYVVNSDGTEQTSLTNSSGGSSNGAWSPDGAKIAFRDQRDLSPDNNFSSELYVMNADGSNQTRLTNTPINEQEPAWSHDGAALTYLAGSIDDSTYDVFVVGADGGEPLNITNTSAWEFSAQWQPLAALLVSDDFNDNSLDTAKWNLNDLFGGSADPNVPIAETEQRLEIGPLLQNVDGPSLSGIRTVNAYNFNDAYSYVELIQAPASDTNAKAMFTVGNIATIGNGVNTYYQIYESGGTLFGQRRSPSGRGFAETTLFSIPYDAVNHRFLRIRHDAATNSLIMDTAPGSGGVPGTWVQQYTEPWNSFISTTSILFEIKGGTSQIEANTPGKVIFDNFHAAISGGNE